MMDTSSSSYGNAIVPHLWFDKEAIAAAEFYCSVFPNSTIKSSTTLRDTPSGDCETVSFNVWGYSFMAISAGPLFKINPSISFIVNFDPSRESNAREWIDDVWDKLSAGGAALMPLGQYPFSERYGWIQDKYGVSWQLMLTNPDGEPRPTIVPSMMFVGENCGKAEEARELYLSVFRNAKPGALFRYGPGHEPDNEQSVMFTDFMLENTWLAAMDSAREHHFQFSEGVSLLVRCETQEEIDHYWERLSADPSAEQCGWIKDKFGVSWQIHSVALEKMLKDGTPEQRGRVTQAFLKMKKFDVAELQEVFRDDF